MTLRNKMKLAHVEEHMPKKRALELYDNISAYLMDCN